MIKVLVCLLIAMVAGCGELEPTTDGDMGREVDSSIEAVVWICHNPESKFHGEVCIDRFEPGRCLSAGENNKFCWLLDPQDCNTEVSLPFNKYCDR